MTPADVVARARQLAAALVTLPRTLAALELARDLLAFSRRPIDAAHVLDRAAELRELAARLAALRDAATPRRSNTGPLRPHAAGAAAPASPPGGGTPATPVMPPPPGPPHGIVTPGDVLAFRQMWDAYVMGTARAAIACADAWDAAATAAKATPPGPMPPGINLAQFGTSTPDADTLQIWADTQRQNSATLVWEWNAHADTPDATLVIQAGAILGDFQNTVLKAGQWYRPQIARDCPNVALPAPPTTDVQAQVIAHLEGLGVLEHGVLQLLGIGAGGALDTLGAVGATIQKTASAIASPGVWLGAAAVLGGVLLLARR